MTLDTIDLIIIRNLAKGKSQVEVAEDMKVLGIEPNSLRTIELRLNKMKINFNVETLFALAVKLGKRNIV